MTLEAKSVLAGSQAEALLRALAQWGPTTTIVQQGDCVFEFKGSFPPGAVSEGYYNLAGATPGFHGHIRLGAIERIAFQERQHRGRDSYAFVFEDAGQAVLFKVFLGRDSTGAVCPDQLRKFHSIRAGQAVDVI